MDEHFLLIVILKLVSKLNPSLSESLFKNLVPVSLGFRKTHGKEQLIPHIAVFNYFIIQGMIHPRMAKAVWFSDQFQQYNCS